MIEKIAFTVYPVVDVARARKFYEEALGLTISWNHENQWVEYTIAGSVFAITNMIPGLKPSTEAGGSIAFEVDDVDRTIEKVCAAGARILVEPFSTPVCRMGVVVDSEGNALTIHRVTA